MIKYPEYLNALTLEKIINDTVLTISIIISNILGQIIFKLVSLNLHESESGVTDAF